MVDWRDHPYEADGYLFILKPVIVFKARVNLAAATYPVAVIPYDGVTLGAITDVKAGMTVLIGSTEGSSDRGRIFVRANDSRDIHSGTNLFIGYCSRGRQTGEVNLLDDSYITILDLYEPWKRASRMLGSGSVLKDYELTLALSGLPPVANMGGVGGMAQMDFVNPTTNKLQVLDYEAFNSYVTTGGSFALAATLWDADDGSYINGTNSSSHDPDIEFPPGARWVQLSVTDTNGMYSLLRQQLVVALATSGGVPGFSAPVERVSEAHLRLTPEGVTFTCKLREALDPDDYISGVPVIWLVKETYAGAEGSVTGYKVKFAGWLDYEQSFGQAGEYDFERVTTLYAVDTAQRANQLRGFPSTMARESTPDNANELKEATLDRYWWWYLVWHTSIPMLADCYWSTVNTPFRKFSSPGGGFYTIVDNVAKAFGYRTTMDSRGRLMVVADPMRQETADRTITVLQSLLPADIVMIDRLKRSRGRVGQFRATFTRASTLDASNAAAPEPDASVTAPGDVEGQGVGSQQNDYPWYAATTAQAQARVGQDYERANAREDHLRIVLAHGGDGGLEPALMQWIEVTTDADTLGWTDDPLTAERCLLLAVEYQYDDQANTQTCVIEVERETVGTPGRVDPIAGDDTPSETPTPGIGWGLIAGEGLIAAFNVDGYLYITANFDAVTPTWARYALGADGTVLAFTVDAYSPLYLGTGTTVNGWLATTTKLYRIEDIFGVTGSPRALTERHTFNVALTASLADPDNCVIDALFSRQNAVVCVRFYRNDGTYPGVWATYTTDDATYNEVQITAFYQTSTGIGTGVTLWADSRSGKFYACAYTATGANAAATAALYESTDGASWAASSAPVVTGLATILANSLHVPFAAAGNVIYWTLLVGGSTSDQSLRRTVNTTVENVSPETNDYGTRFNRGLVSHPLNAERAAVMGIKNATVSALWTTANLSDSPPTWTKRTADATYTANFASVNFAGDDQDVLFLWGYGGTMGWTDDFGVTVHDKRGNIPVDFPTIGQFLNICGGGG